MNFRALSLSTKQNPALTCPVEFCVCLADACCSVHPMKEKVQQGDLRRRRLAGITVRERALVFLHCPGSLGPCLEIEDLVWKPMISGSAASKSTVRLQGICSARTELLYVKSRYIGPLIPISFSYLKPFLLGSYLGSFRPGEAPDQCFFCLILFCYPTEYLKFEFVHRFCQSYWLLSNHLTLPHSLASEGARFLLGFPLLMANQGSVN